MIIRAMLYTLIVGAIAALSVKWSSSTDARWFFTEGGPVEWTQLVVLLLCSGLLFATWRLKKWAPDIALVLAFLPLGAMAREMDTIFNRLVFQRAHWIPIGIFIALAVITAWRTRARLPEQAEAVARTSAFGYLVAGFITVMAQSRILGQQKFWAGIYDDNTHRLTGRVVEESGELFGYLLLLFGCIELLWRAREAPGPGIEREP